MTIDEPVKRFCELHGMTDPREEELVQHLMDGKSYGDICQIMFYTYMYVARACFKIFQKTGMSGTKKNSRYNLMAYIYKLTKEDKHDQIQQRQDEDTRHYV